MPLNLVSLLSADFNDSEKVLCNLCQKDETRPYCVKTTNGFPHQFNFVECIHCELIYLNPRPSIASLNKLYSSREYFQGKEKAIGYFDYLGEESFRRKTAQAKLKKIERLLGKKGRLLEIGCAAGFFAATAKDRGWEVTGLDISEPMIEYARAAYGLEALANRFEDIDPLTHPVLRKDSYDVIACWGTLGTFLDPLGNFLKMNLLLKEGGLLVFNASNAESLTARILKSRWYLLQPSAAHVYNSRTLARLLQHSGFAAIRMGTDKHHLDLYKFFTQKQLIRESWVDSIARRIRNISLARRPFPLPNFGFLECYARKIKSPEKT